MIRCYNTESCDIWYDRFVSILYNTWYVTIFMQCIVRYSELRYIMIRHVMLYDMMCLNTLSYDVLYDTLRYIVLFFYHTIRYVTTRSFTMHYVVRLLIYISLMRYRMMWYDMLRYDQLWAFTLHYAVSLPRVNATVWLIRYVTTPYVMIWNDLIHHDLLQYSVYDDAWWSIAILNHTIPHDGILTQRLAWYEEVLNIFLWSRSWSWPLRRTAIINPTRFTALYWRGRFAF